jgi:hypothetical protein
MNSKDTPSATSSPGSPDGPSLFNLLDGLLTVLFGQEAAPVSLSAPQAKDSPKRTNGTSGLSSLTSSASAALQSCSESKSPPPLSSGCAEPTRACNKCGIEKPSSDFSAEKGRRPRASCKACKNLQTSSRRKENYSTDRISKRGMILVSAARYRARKAGIPFNLEQSDISARIQAGVCEMTGIPFDLTKPKSWNCPSLDQITPGAGYTKDNVRVVIYSANVMSHNWGPNLILKVAESIKTQRREKSNDLSQKLAARLKVTLPSGSMEYKMTWKELVTPSGRVLWQHQASNRPINDSASTGWPTTTTRDHKDTGDLSQSMVRKDGKPRNDTLGRVAFGLTGWPTPKAQEDGSTPEQYEARRQRAYANRKGKTSGGPSGKQGGLAIAAQLTGCGLTSNSSTAETGKPAAYQLNPHFSRWLMGFPPEWCDCAVTAMQSFLSVRKPSSKRSSK